MVYRLRPHHIDALITREKVSRNKRAAIIEATSELYGDRSFAVREREFIESVDGNTLVEVVLGNDYICDNLKCPFASKCKTKDYKEVADILASRLSGDTSELAKQLTPEISDKWAMRRYGLEAGRTYRLKDISVVNASLSIDDL